MYIVNEITLSDRKSFLKWEENVRSEKLKKKKKNDQMRMYYFKKAASADFTEDRGTE